MNLKSTPVREAIARYKAGEMVILIDAADRENEGDLAMATERITPEAVRFMLQEARGLICVSISGETATRLNLPLQTVHNHSAFGTPFAVSIDHRSVSAEGVTAAGRARTMLEMTNSLARSEDFQSPGHVFPLVADSAGVIGRQGQTEGSFDLARLAGLAPSGVICEIMNSDGTMARGEALAQFAEKHKLAVVTIADLVRFRIDEEILVRPISEAIRETDAGPFLTTTFQDDVTGKEHLALVYRSGAKVAEGAVPLVRIHSECLTGDVFGSRRCDCGPQLQEALQAVVRSGFGAVIYLSQEGRGIGLTNKLKAYALQDQGDDTVEANVKLGFSPDARDFAVAAKILHAIGMTKVRLLTNNPQKFETLKNSGIEIVERLPIVVAPDEYSKAYLETKRTKLGHWL